MKRIDLVLRLGSLHVLLRPFVVDYRIDKQDAAKDSRLFYLDGVRSN